MSKVYRASDTRPARNSSSFDHAGFQPSGYGRSGECRPESHEGPGAIKGNASAFKTFRRTGQKRLRFRAEFFNPFNHTNLNNPIGVMSHSNSGRIQGAAAGRVVQFDMKFLY